MNSKRDLLPPTILVVDDEQQVHASVKLRVGKHHRVLSAYNPDEALTIIEAQNLDLCIVDIQMPGMDGMALIEEARKIDPCLGCVILSGHDSAENLRRAIPLSVFDFLSKPLPDRTRFEQRLPTWIETTRAHRREKALATKSDTIFHDLELAQIEREVEAIASDSAREALFQTSGMLTTSQALLLGSCHALEALGKTQPPASSAIRSLQEARKHLEGASSIIEGFFGSAYANRESSPAIVETCLRHACAIATRLAKIEERKQTLEYQSPDRDLVAVNLTGMDFLMLAVPVLVQAAALAENGTTIRVQNELIPRLEDVYQRPNFQSLLWINRRNAISSHPGILLWIRANAPTSDEREVSAWLKGETTAQLKMPSHGLVRGVQKARGLMGIATKPRMDRLEIALVLPI